MGTSRELARLLLADEEDELRCGGIGGRAGGEAAGDVGEVTCGDGGCGGDGEVFVTLAVTIALRPLALPWRVGLRCRSSDRVKSLVLSITDAKEEIMAFFVLLKTSFARLETPPPPPPPSAAGAAFAVFPAADAAAAAAVAAVDDDVEEANDIVLEDEDGEVEVEEEPEETFREWRRGGTEEFTSNTGPARIESNACVTMHVRAGVATSVGQKCIVSKLRF